MSVKCQACNNITTNPSGFCYLHEGMSKPNGDGTQRNGVTVPIQSSTLTQGTDSESLPGRELMGEPRLGRDENGEKIEFVKDGVVIAIARRGEGVAGMIDFDDEGSYPRRDEDGERIDRDYESDADEYTDAIARESWPEWGTEDHESGSPSVAPVELDPDSAEGRAAAFMNILEDLRDGKFRGSGQLVSDPDYDIDLIPERFNVEYQLEEEYDPDGEPWRSISITGSKENLQRASEYLYQRDTDYVPRRGGFIEAGGITPEEQARAMKRTMAREANKDDKDFSDDGPMFREESKR